MNVDAENVRVDLKRLAKNISDPVSADEIKELIKLVAELADIVARSTD